MKKNDVTKVARQKKPDATILSDPATKREECRLLIHSILQQLCKSDYEKLAVSFTVGEQSTVFKVDCTREHIGLIIGQQGRTISALRVIVTAIMGAAGMRAIVEIPFIPLSSK